ncbi:DUF2269 family protein [Aromatoleum diolicum]|uniref:DUF2269 family protein n=1 Tax=Aromatoleum diolicum TaxID=75796 RepID=A0ABX1QEI2_9RHOO|nr:DUF2269 domain-containing protein [Aromatoleum diolicum]NMG75920.1 DUF2269 family protein [Aromatoleum diolicum]
MSAYLTLKTLHIISSVLLVGTGFGSAFYLFFANRVGSVAGIAVVCRLVVRADWWFTTPAAIVQPLSGVTMIYLAGWPLSSPWLVLSLCLYGLAGLCWLPVVWLQIRMAGMAAEAAATAQELPETFWRYAGWWERLGYPAFISMAVVFYLMVAKPVHW